MIKKYYAWFGMLISVSAPTQVDDLAIKYNVALGGFIKKDKIVAYTFPDRFVNKRYLFIWTSQYGYRIKWGIFLKQCLIETS